MKIVVLEYFTSGALHDASLSAELSAEGDAMLQAILDDMLNHTPWQPIVLRDQRLPALDKVDSIQVTSAIHFQQAWQQLLLDEALFLLIAPETDDVLLNLATAVIDAGKHLLGCQPSVIKLCSDKLRCGDFLAASDFTVPLGQIAVNWLHEAKIPCPVVIKPRDGAGCQQTTIFSQLAAAQAYLISLPAAVQHQLLVQPYLKGNTLSLSLFIDNEKAIILSLNQQLITQYNDQLHYHGSQILAAWPDNFSKVQAEELVMQLNQAMPGLLGFVGIDLIISDDKAWMIDINPRLTTSFNHLPNVGIQPAKLLYTSTIFHPEHSPND